MVDEILDKKYDPITKSHLYLVKWEGFNKDHNTWEPESSLLEDVPEMVVDYNDKIEESLVAVNYSLELYELLEINDCAKENVSEKGLTSSQPVLSIKDNEATLEVHHSSPAYYSQAATS